MNRYIGYVIAVAFVLFATLIRGALDLSGGAQYPVYFASLVAAIVCGGPGPGLVALVLGGVLSSAPFNVPGTVLALDRAWTANLLLYLIAGGGVVYLAARLRRAARRIEEKSGTVPDRQQALEQEIARPRHAEAEVERLDEELTRKLQEFELILQESPIGMAFVRDPECREVWGNPAFCRLLGLPAGINVSLSGPNADKLHLRVYRQGRELQAEELPLRRCATTGQPVLDEEIEVRRKDGSSAFLLGDVVPLLEHGRVRGCVGTFVDITERKRFEEALRASEARERGRARELETVMHAVPAVMFIAEDPACRTIRTNRAGYEMLRLPEGVNASKSAPTEEAPTNFRVLRNGVELPPGDLPVQRAARGQEVKNFEEDIVFEDGTVNHMIGNAVPLRDEQGRVQGAVAAFVDITERKRAERALQESEELFRGLAEGMPHMVWQTDARGDVNYQNHVWYDYIGEAPGGALGEDWLRYCHPDDRERLAAAWTQSLCTEGAHVYDAEARIRRHDGVYRWFRVAGAPVRAAATGAVVKWVGTCTDIEDQKRAEQAFKETDRRKDEFLATLGHELRNPLAPIRNAIEIIRKNLNDERRRAWALEVIDRQLYQLSRIIDDLLELARVASGKVGLKREAVALREVVFRAVETVRPVMQAKGQKLRVELPQEAVTLHADRARLVQVVSNLLHNGVRHTPRAGMIAIMAFVKEGRLELYVRDTGEGIDPEHLPQVFDMFRRTPGSAKTDGGLGIGLAFAKRIVELHGGSISAHSEGSGMGSEFRINLPLAPAAAPVPFSPPGETPKPGGQRKRVLVVDDNEDAADSVSELLKMYGHEVECLYEGGAAMRRSLEFRPDVVLLDIGLPGADGYEIARRFRADPALCSLPLVALTGRGQEADKNRARQSGFDFHFTKPLDPRELIEFVGSLEVRPGNRQETRDAG